MKNIPGNKLNQRIQEALINLTDGGEFAGQVERLLNTLGYTSERKPLEGTENIREIVEQKTAKTKADQLLIDESLVAEVVFQITDEEVQPEPQGSFLEEGESFRSGEAGSFIFSCAELKGDSYKPNRFSQYDPCREQGIFGSPFSSPVQVRRQALRGTYRQAPS